LGKLEVLVTLRAGIEAESGRSKLKPALGKTGTIAGTARAISSVEVSKEIAAAALTLLPKGASGTASHVFVFGVPGRRPSSHRGDWNTVNGGALQLTSPVKP
jgi:hypothetical protein